MKRPILSAFVLATLVACAPPPPDPCKSRKPGDLVLTEYLNDPPGIDTGKEYLELYNATAATIELKGLTVYTSKLDGTSLKTHVLRAGSVPSRGYFTLGDVRAGEVNPAYIGYSYEDGLGALANGEGVLGLKCASVVIDEVKYQTAPKAGRARTFDGLLQPNATLNDDEASWCEADAEFVPGLFGSPAMANEPC
ncbi:MAG: lamin tail domain-containing protein, partial [Myxococcaceae bacterium]